MKKEGVSIGWMIVAIILMVVVVLETLFIIWIFSAGSKMIEKDNICAYNICNLGETDSQYEAYLYDDVENICYCYTDGEVVHQEVMTGMVIFGS